MIRIDNARVFDGERVLDGVCVVVDGELITAVAPAGQLAAGSADCEVIDGSGQTLVPGLIDSHAFVMGTLDNLRLALAFGVTTELDMFGFTPELTGWLCGTAAQADDLADMRTCGTVARPPGHPLASVLALDSIAGPADAAEFVTARQKESAHYIKVMLAAEPEPGLDLATARAVAEAARSAGLPTIAHIAGNDTIRDALSAGIDAIAHVPLDAPIPPDIAAGLAAGNRACIPNLAAMELSVMELSVNGRGGRELAQDPRIAGYLPADAGAAMRTGTAAPYEAIPPGGLDLDHALESVKRLRAAGVELLAGTSSSNAPGRACPVVHGAAMHRELRLLVLAGLTPAQALTAATSAPARRFGLEDRGLIAPGRRADLLLVRGDPTVDITATRDIARIWKRGVPFDRDRFQSTRVRASADELTSLGSTALGVAVQRATESRRPDALFDDQTAIQVVAAAWSQQAARFGSHREAMRQVLGDYVAIRTRFFDDYLRDAVGSGLRQAVILAAGLDARAYRLDWPGPVRLFEVDRPDVFCLKDRIVTGRSPHRDCERVAVFSDLTTDWPPDLLAHGFDPGQPTAWLVEGLVMFLSEQEADGMLTRIGELSAPGSRIGVDDGSMAVFKTAITTALAGTANAIDEDSLGKLSSLWRNDRSSDPADWLAGHGWSTVCESVADAMTAYGRPVPPAFDPVVTGTSSMMLLFGEIV